MFSVTGKLLLNLILSMLLIFTMCGFVSANIVDPTAPPYTPKTKRISRPASPPKLDLTSILYSDQRRLALINNRMVKVGDKVSAAEVTDIQSGWVKLNWNGRVIVLRLYSSELVGIKWRSTTQ